MLADALEHKMYTRFKDRQTSEVCSGASPGTRLPRLSKYIHTAHRAAGVYAESCLRPSLQPRHLLSAKPPDSPIPTTPLTHPYQQVYMPKGADDQASRHATPRRLNPVTHPYLFPDRRSGYQHPYQDVIPPARNSIAKAQPSQYDPAQNPCV